MTITITHPFVSPKPDGADATLIQPSDWNEAHSLAGLGVGVEAFLSIPSSANLAAAVSDETGSGALVFGTAPTLTAPVISTITNTGTLTLPTSTDTLVGRATTDTLTNKTLTAPAINGTVTTTGLTLPAFTLSGAVTGGGQNVSGLGTLGCGAITTSATITKTGTLNANNTALTAQGSGTGWNIISVGNSTTTDAIFGIESSVGGTAATGSTAYAALVGSNGNYPTQIISNATVVASFAPTSLTLGSGITSISGGTNPSLNIGTGALTAGKAVVTQVHGDGTTQLSIMSNNLGQPIVFYDGVGGVSAVERGRFDTTGLAVTGLVSSSSDMRVLKDGSDTAISGATYLLGNAAGTRFWGMQLSASNNLDWWHLDGGSWSKKMTLDASGNLIVGASSWTGTTNAILATPDYGGVGGVAIAHASGSASGSIFTAYIYNGGTIGSITQSGTTAVLYNTTSDERLKENITDATSASSLIDVIQVRQFDWKSDGSHQRYGFVAQELVTVAPEAVHQPADPDDMMAVDYSKLVPMLVKEVQSLRARLAALEAA